MQNINTIPKYIKCSKNSFFPEPCWLRSASVHYNQYIGFVSHFNTINTFRGSSKFGVVPFCRL